LINKEERKVAEQQLPIPEELDTELHSMSGPPTTTPEWILESWKKAAEASKVAENKTEQG